MLLSFADEPVTQLRVVPRVLTRNAVFRALVPDGAGAFLICKCPAMLRLEMDITFHLVSKNYFDSMDGTADYVPEAFAREGFIHCTDDAEEMARIANLLYKDEPPPHIYLYIDKQRVHAPVRYDDAEQKYPHIYGSLNREAIVAIRQARRDAEGNFLPPEQP